MKHILSTTAVLALIATPTFAQLNADADADANLDAQVSADADVDADVDTDVDADVGVDSGAEAAIEGDDDAEASTAAGMTLSSDAMIGAEIYDSAGAAVGTVADLIVDGDGHLVQVIAEIGGILGLGAKEVAIERAQIEIEAEGEADLRVHVAMTQEELEELPEYEG